MIESLFLFDRQDQFIRAIPAEVLISASDYEKLNSEWRLSFSLLHQDADQVTEGYHVAYYDDIEDCFKYYEIMRVTGSRTEYAEVSVEADGSHYELLDDYTGDLRPSNRSADYVLGQILDDTRWQVGDVADLGTYSTNFYKINKMEAVQKLVDIWGGELRFRVEITGNEITGRYVDLLTRRGSDTGKRYTHDKDLESITRTVDNTELKTAVIGYGRGEEVGDGFGRRTTFEDVEWSVSNGDPVDKPSGQDWVGDPDALAKWGRVNADSSLRHRFGEFEDSEQEDPEQLLQDAWDYLQTINEPIVNYDGRVIDLFRIDPEMYEHERAVLGDTAAVLDDDLGIEQSARLIELDRDLLEPENDHVVLGRFLPLFTDPDERVEAVISRVNRSSGAWDRPEIDKNNFPDIKPEKPDDVNATGAFRTNQIRWQFTDETYVEFYEVFGSQVQVNVTNPDNLLWRGKVSAFSHEVDTDQTWYYRVRAVNYHGRTSDWSDEVMASTVRIITDDILFGSITADLLDDLAVEARSLADGSVKAEKIATAAVGTAAIANAAIDAAKIGTAVIDTSHVNFLSGEKIVAETITSDKMSVSELSSITADLGTVTAGILQSSNNNTFFNLNTGELHKENSDITFGSGANINFESVGNKMTYRRFDDESGFSRAAGVGFGAALGGRYPFTYLGTNGSSELDTLSQFYSGFIANTTARIAEGGANSVSGFRFQLRNRAVDWDKGVTFDFNGSTPSISLIGGSSNYEYEIGTLRRIFGRQTLDFLNNFNETSGWMMQTNYSGEGEDIVFGPRRTQDYDYQLGRSSHRIRNIYLTNSPNVSSDERLKEDFSDNTLGIDFLKTLETKTFRMKSRNGESNPKTFGIIAQNLKSSLDSYGVDTADVTLLSEGSDGMYGVQQDQLIIPLIKAVQELTERVEELENAK